MGLDRVAINSKKRMADTLSHSPRLETTDERRLVGAGLTPEGIAALDWLRLADLVRGLVVEVGCELGGSQVGMDGSVVFGMVEKPGSDQAQRVVVKLVGWNRWGVGPEEVEHFAEEVRGAREARGILVAPAGFSPTAKMLARQLKIEAVDAVGVWSALQRLQQDRRHFLWQIASGGDAWSPSCPVCLRKLVKQAVQSVFEPVCEVERVFAADAIVADMVYCEKLMVARDVAVQFLQQVRANRVEIAGEVTGDLLCDGPLVLRPSAVLHGRVAARAVQVEDGAQLLASTTVLRGGYKPVPSTQVTTWQWRCGHGRADNGCGQVVFEPHESGSEGGDGWVGGSENGEF